MRLDRIAIALRLREPWEAIDLGAVMIRAWWRPVFKAWFVVFLPIALAASLLFDRSPWIALLVVWWLKPLYDRVILHMLSQAVFGEPPGVRATLAGLGRLIRSTGIVGALTWRRFDPVRAFNLPVRQLEGQQGEAARARERLLGRRASGQATGLLYACIGFELLLLLSLGVCRDLVLPAGVATDSETYTFFGPVFGAGQEQWHEHLRNALYFLALCIVEPIYVASGFALYLNRRTALEAWDLELAFRRLDQAAATAPRSFLGALIAGLMALLAFSAPAPTWAAQDSDRSSRQIIKEVLAAPDFKEFEDKLVWRYRGKRDEAQKPETGSTYMNLLTSIAEALSQLSRIGAFVAIAVALFFIVRYLVKSAKGWSGSHGSAKPPQGPPPETLFGLDVRPDSLPEDLAELAARAAVRDPRMALSLLYRGALATLIHRDGLRIENGDTEGDCLRRVRIGHAVELAQYFSGLVAAWSVTAYAGRSPEAERIRALCAEWSRHFGAASRGGGA